jgi:hypothetical protein
MELQELLEKTLRNNQPKKTERGFIDFTKHFVEYLKQRMFKYLSRKEPISMRDQVLDNGSMRVCQRTQAKHVSAIGLQPNEIHLIQETYR